jgi:protein-glucosylgalactosylhydroxylysine glucosidase
VRSFDPRACLTVGNGELAFTADASGLQTFPEIYTVIPLCTQSQWGWHSFPGQGLKPSDLKLEMFDTHGRQAGYATGRPAGGQEKLVAWLRENPHRLHLGRISLAGVRREDFTAIDQTLDLWTGLLTSRFRLSGEAVEVTTCCDPGRDLLAVRISSRVPVAIAIDFPYGSPDVPAADWHSPDRHRSVVESGVEAGLIRRELDADRHWVRVSAERGVLTRAGDHRFELKSPGELSASIEFSPTPIALAPPKVGEVIEANRRHWARFWQDGAAIDFSGSRDRRAAELERRVVLSQYLTAIQCSGSLPPQETGLTCNSWYGKYHLEMHWWHAAHFPMWNRTALLERSLGWYNAILPSAREKAKQQGYTGARWPKMTAPDGRSSPSPIGEMLIWQQPHPIVMAELCYTAHPDRQTLERYRDMVMESAEFMASFAYYEASRDRYVLGPPVIPAQENHPPRETWNPAFELEYWHNGLGIAQQWRKRLGLGLNPKWEEVRSKLSALPVRDGVYLAHENCPQTFTERNRDHPSMLGALGVLPGAKVDREIMRATLKRVFRDWKWEDTWGWDFPMVAMTAAALGEKDLVVDALFAESPKNTWLPNGHNWQRTELPLYLPGNGALLIAMAKIASQFPASWTIRTEGFPQAATRRI